jgi:hypothetical protein
VGRCGLLLRRLRGDHAVGAAVTAITPSDFEAFVRRAEHLFERAHFRETAEDRLGAGQQRMDGFRYEWNRYVKLLRAEVAAGLVMR